MIEFKNKQLSCISINGFPWSNKTERPTSLRIKKSIFDYGAWGLDWIRNLNKPIKPYEICLKLKHSEISFTHNKHFTRRMLLKFCAENGSVAAVRWYYVHNFGRIRRRKKEVLGKRECAWYQFKITHLKVQMPIFSRQVHTIYPSYGWWIIALKYRVNSHATSCIVISKHAVV